MTTLTEFLMKSDVSLVTDEVAISERIQNPETKQPYKFKIKAISDDDYSEYQKQCTTYGKKGKVTFDSAKLNRLLVINHTVEPNFRDTKVIAELKCQTPENYMKKVLLAGEISLLASKISELSGFDKEMDDLVEDSKNS